MLRAVPGYEALEALEVRTSPRSRQGANWKIDRVHPAVLHNTRKQWGLYTDAVAELMARLDLADELDNS
jgi:hypothetical protein